MKLLPTILVLAVVVASAIGRQHDHPPMALAPSVVMEGVDVLHHAVLPSSPEATRPLDQERAIARALDYDEAVASFRRAAELDPRCAMTLRGVDVVARYLSTFRVRRPVGLGA